MPVSRTSTPVIVSDSRSETLNASLEIESLLSLDVLSGNDEEMLSPSSWYHSMSLVLTAGDSLVIANWRVTLLPTTGQTMSGLTGTIVGITLKKEAESDWSSHKMKKSLTFNWHSI